MYDYGARNYDPALGRWMNNDPLAERHPEISPFVYCANVPTYLIDPDGKDWRIYYQDKNNERQEFIYKGGSTVLPDNQFVRDFVAAYNYNVENGGGDSMKAIAENSKIMVDVQKTSGDSNYDDSKDTKGNDVLNWNPKWGLMTDNGSMLSPATILEHESAHGLGNKTGTSASDKDVRGNPYQNPEEERVITGPEQKTAHANGEVPYFMPTRKNHYGLPIITNSPTSNKPNVTKTKEYHNKQQEAGNFYGIPFSAFKR